MDDLSQMSDEDLQRLYSEKKQQQAEPPRAANDFSHLSDDELKKLYYSTRQSKESFMHSKLNRFFVCRLTHVRIYE